MASRADLVRGALDAFGWILGLLAAIWLVGFPPALVLFVFGYLFFRSREKWWAAALTTAVLVALLYFFFEDVLHVLWPEGVLDLGL
jgi:hypothetical protein